MNKPYFFVILFSIAFIPFVSNAQYTEWTHSGTINIMTTPQGANIPNGVTETNFPALVSLNSDFFDFNQAKIDGSDIRFSSGTTPLPYQIEAWNPTEGTASIWVLIPEIQGNTIQPINIHWGNTAAVSESDGTAVFNNLSGFLSVFHMDDPAVDAAGTVTPVATGTSQTQGIVGLARRFEKGNGIKIENITSYPVSNNPRTIGVWINTETTGDFIGIGNAVRQGKVVLSSVVGLNVNVDGWFSDANVTGTKPFSFNEWVYVVHSYQSGNTNLYINGSLDATKSSGTPLNITSPQRLWLGGWTQSGLNYAGEMDEVRISNVARSANWVKMEYENQKPFQTMTGWIVPSGSTFSVSQTTATMPEGSTMTFTGTAGGAIKTIWTLIDGSQESIIAINKSALDFTAMRINQNKNITLRFTAIYANEVKTSDINVSITEAQPDPEFTINSPETWNGRDAIEVSANILNLSAIQAAGVGNLNYTWDVSGIAVTKQVTNNILQLTRAHNSGALQISLTIDNGGTPIKQTAVINVTEPESDPWLIRTPDTNEKPVSGQFYARNNTNGKCAIHFNGTQPGASSVYLKVLEDGVEINKITKSITTTGAYQFTIEVDPKLAKYTVEFGTADGVETPVKTVDNLVCGDAYIIEGQSNAVAYDFGTDDFPTTSEWIRTFDKSAGWLIAQKRNTGAIGYWGLEMARDLVNTYNIPICIINGAAGGTRIDLHLRNENNPIDNTTIYGRLLERVKLAKLTHNIRGIFWHQGENNSGAADPTGEYDYVNYQRYFIQMASAWKEDFPNIQNYYLFQVYPRPCAMGPTDDELRNEQRKLPTLYSNMSIMSTVGVVPAGAGTCHFSAQGYMNFKTLIRPLVERDNYGFTPIQDITAPEILNAYYTSNSKNEIILEFNQTMDWNPESISNFYLDEIKNKVVSGSASGNLITLNLSEASNATSLRYVRGADWNGDANNLLKGSNGIAALTFCNFAISDNLDCNGDINGTAYYDSCNTCVGGNTGLQGCTLSANENDINTSHFTIYPNPNNGSFKVQLVTKEPVNLNVFNVLGKLVYSKHINPTDTSLQLDLTEQPSGMYFIKLTSKNINQVKKVILTH